MRKKHKKCTTPPRQIENAEPFTLEGRVAQEWQSRQGRPSTIPFTASMQKYVAAQFVLKADPYLAPKKQSNQELNTNAIDK